GSQLLHAIRKREIDLMSAARHPAELYKERITQFVHDGGLAFWSPLPGHLLSDVDLRSRVVVFEDGERLGPSHSVHDDILQHERGRYSHWGDGLYFASSDGSDPRHNGRRYTVEEMTEADSPMVERLRLDPIKPETGLCCTAPVPSHLPSDCDSTSRLVVLEDGLPLPLPHALHDDIRRKGGGRYSHWGADVWFSASDGSDPHTNGRIYEIV